ncbi:MAG: hypothetical protein ACK5JO_01685 [Halodesulfovibrio sp.]
MDFSTLAKLRRHLSIKHHIPGRLRLRFSKSVLADPAAVAVIKAPPAKPKAVFKADLNLMAQSVTIEYDAQIIPPDLLNELLGAPDDIASAKALETLHQLLYAA